MLRPSCKKSGVGITTAKMILELECLTNELVSTMLAFYALVFEFF